MEIKKPVDFPEIENKLQAPTKKSAFERQKADAEAKRLREEAENAAALKDFVKSFDDENDDDDNGRLRHGGGGFRGGFTPMSGPPSRRHFGGPSVPSGPGGRGRGGMAPSLQGTGRKRPFDHNRKDKSLLAFDDDDDDDHRPASKAFGRSDDEETTRHASKAEPLVPKPTLQLALLPPGTSPAVIKALLPPSLTVDAVRIMAATGPGAATERKSMSAIVTLAKDTAANDIDTAVSALQNRYLGYGFYLSLHRHLSSAAISSRGTTNVSSGISTMPFGAKQVQIEAPVSHHGPPGHRGGFAPPTSYGSPGPARSGALHSVAVHAPRDIKELKLIHKTIENLLTHGPDFEALLMSRPEVQREEKWAWLWDARSTGGVWYRWRLWEILTGSQPRRGQGKYVPVFEDSFAWKGPDIPLPYEYTTTLDEFVSDSEYNSSDDDDSGDEASNRRPDGEDGIAYLNPLENAKLTHLLARLPTSTAKLRKGDVARVTAFAIAHAGRGADEVVAALVANIEQPFAYTSANPHFQPQGADEEEEEDTSSASIIGLYLVSDILSACSTAGVRHAWRYRALFEGALRTQKVFESLGRMEKKLKWGKLRAEKWRRSVNMVLSLWEGWCVFAAEAQAGFVSAFENPPLTAAEEEEEHRKAAEAEEASKTKGRWKTVDAKKVEAVAAGLAFGSGDGDVDGDPMDEDDDEDDNIDGVPMEDSSDEEEEAGGGDAMQVDVEPAQEPQKQEGLPGPLRQPRKRPQAKDMFANSDSEDGEGS